MNFMAKERLLTFEEITRLAKIFTSMGVKKIRFTGGEPTVRADFPKLVQMVRDATKLKNLAITTNGARLEELAAPLKESGIRKVNISLDTLKEEKFNTITQRKAFKKVMAGIDTAIEAGFDEIKINTVAIRTFNLDEVIDLVEFGIGKGVVVRFIELMPFYNNQWERENVVPMDEILSILETKYDLTPVQRNSASQTSLEFTIDGDPQKRVGFIASVTKSFCQWCDRVRITADGKIRPCLHSAYEIDLIGLLRDKQKNDEDVASAIRNAVWNKSEGHEDFLSDGFVLPIKDRPMMRIGG